jgi:hypothetical protein
MVATRARGPAVEVAIVEEPKSTKTAAPKAIRRASVAPAAAAKSPVKAKEQPATAAAKRSRKVDAKEEPQQKAATK